MRPRQPAAATARAASVVLVLAHLAVLATAPAAAQSPAVVPATHVEVHGGLEASGELAFWLRVAGPGAGISLTAARVDATTWDATYPSVAGEGSWVLAPAERSSHAASRVAATSWSESATISVLPLDPTRPPRVAWTAADTALHPGEAGCLRDPSPMGDFMWPCHDVARTARVASGETPATVRIQGSVRLHLHGWNGTTSAASGVEHWSTGHTATHLAPGVALERERALTLDLRDAVVELTLRAPLDGLHMANVDLAASGAMRLVHEDGSESLLPGPVMASARFQNGRAYVAVEPASAPAPALGMTWGIFGAAVGCLLAIIAVLAALALRPRDPVVRALHRGGGAAAARAAADAPPATRPEEALARAIGYMHAGRLEDAERELQAPVRPGPPPTTSSR